VKVAILETILATIAMPVEARQSSRDAGRTKSVHVAAFKANDGGPPRTKSPAQFDCWNNVDVPKPIARWCEFAYERAN
jgi:hypothetical protein